MASTGAKLLRFVLTHGSPRFFEGRVCDRYFFKFLHVHLSCSGIRSVYVISSCLFFLARLHA